MSVPSVFSFSFFLGGWEEEKCSLQAPFRVYFYVNIYRTFFNSLKKVLMNGWISTNGLLTLDKKILRMSSSSKQKEENYKGKRKS